MEHVYWLAAIAAVLLLFVAGCDILCHDGPWSPLSLTWDKPWIQRICRFIMLLIVPALAITETALIVSTEFGWAISVLMTIACLGISAASVIFARLVAIMILVSIGSIFAGIWHLFKFIFE